MAIMSWNSVISWSYLFYDLAQMEQHHPSSWRNDQFWAIATTYKCYYGKLLVGWDIQYNIMHILINLGCSAYEFTRMKRKIRIIYEKWLRNKYKWTDLSSKAQDLDLPVHFFLSISQDRITYTNKNTLLKLST